MTIEVTNKPTDIIEYGPYRETVELIERMATKRHTAKAEYLQHLVKADEDLYNIENPPAPKQKPEPEESDDAE